MLAQVQKDKEELIKMENKSKALIKRNNKALGVTD